MTRPLAAGLLRASSLAADTIRQGIGDGTDVLQTDALIRRQVSIARRIDLVGLSGGTGCSHLAARLAILFAKRRGTRVLAVDAGRGTLTRLVGAQPATFPGFTRDSDTQPLGRLLHASVSVNRADDAIAGLLTGTAGLRVASAAGLDGLCQRPRDWYAATNPVLKYFDIVLTDWGYRSPGIDFESAISGSHTVVLVCRAQRPAIETAISVEAAVARQIPCLVCAVDVDGVGPTAVRTAIRWGATSLFYIPFLKKPWNMSPPGLRRTMITLAAKLMEMSTSAIAIPQSDPANLPVQVHSAARALATLSGGSA